MSLHQKKKEYIYNQTPISCVQMKSANHSTVKSGTVQLVFHHIMYHQYVSALLLYCRFCMVRITKVSISIENSSHFFCLCCMYKHLCKLHPKIRPKYKKIKSDLPLKCTANKLSNISIYSPLIKMGPLLIHSMAKLSFCLTNTPGRYKKATDFHCDGWSAIATIHSFLLLIYKI
jgi:hypothetical protein